MRAYVQGYLADRLEEARKRLRAYADRFTAVMLEALETACQGEWSSGGLPACRGGCAAHQHPGAGLCCASAPSGAGTDAGWGMDMDCLLTSPCHCCCHVLHAGEAERTAALEVAEERCAAVAELLDDVQELQGRVEQASLYECLWCSKRCCWSHRLAVRPQIPCAKCLLSSAAAAGTYATADAARVGPG